MARNNQLRGNDDDEQPRGLTVLRRGEPRRRRPFSPFGDSQFTSDSFELMPEQPDPEELLQRRRRRWGGIGAGAAEEMGAQSGGFGVRPSMPAGPAGPGPEAPAFNLAPQPGDPAPPLPDSMFGPNPLPSATEGRSRYAGERAPGLLRDRGFLQNYLAQRTGVNLQEMQNFDYTADQGFQEAAGREAERRYLGVQKTLDPYGFERSRLLAQFRQQATGDPTIRGNYLRTARGYDPNTGLPYLPGFQADTDAGALAAANAQAAQEFDLRNRAGGFETPYSDRWTFIGTGGVPIGDDGQPDYSRPILYDVRPGESVYRDELGREIVVDQRGRVRRR